MNANSRNRREEYVITTINKKTFSYRVVKREPRSLAPNQVAFRIKIEIDNADWFKRILEVYTPPVKPPEIAMTLSYKIAKDTPDAVMDRLYLGRILR